MLLLLVPLAFLFVFIGLISELRGLSEESASAIAESRSVIAQTQLVMRALGDAEAGLRGYAITRDRDALIPYHRARRQLPFEFDRLLVMVSENPVQLSAARRLQEKAKSVLEEFAGLLQEIEKDAPGDVEPLVPLFRRTVPLMAEIRGDGNILLAHEERFGALMEEALEDRWNTIDRALLIGTFVAAILTVLMGILLGRDISRRLTLLARNARQFAEGRALLPAVGGSDEIGQLDRAFREMADALNHANQRERALMENAADVICSFGVDGKLVAVSRASESLWGYSPSELVGRSWLDLLVPLDELGPTRAAIAKLQSDGGTCTFETRCRRADGTFISVMWTASWSSEEKLVFGVARDVTDRKVAEAERQFYLETIDSLEEAIFELDNMLIVRQASHAWYPLSGYEVGDCLGAPLALHAHADDRETLRAACEEVLNGVVPQTRTRVRLVRKDGGEAWVDTHLMPHRDVYGTISGVRGVMRDITQAHLQERKIAQLALHDQLTGLPNRALFEDRLQVALVAARRTGQKVGLAFIDVDHFKSINDTLGHAVGDQVLRGIAQNLSAELRKGDTLSRWGGDEFIVLLPDLGKEHEAISIAQRLIIAARPVSPSPEYPVSLSIGLAVFPDHADGPESLMNQADRAMYKAKHDGRDRLQVFAPDLDAELGPGRFSKKAS
jgi:diguanylate cyclase (GGDEF)-like protein/PAS domain S-box-containing protein